MSARRAIGALLSACVATTIVVDSAPVRVVEAAGLAIDVSVKTHPTAASTSITTAAFSTTQPGDLLVAFIASDGPGTGASTISTVTTTGLTWRLRQRVNTRPGTAEIWQAVATNVLTNVTVRATRASGSYVSMLDVVAFSGANTTVDGAVAGASSAAGAPSVSLTTTRAGSWVWGVGNDWSSATARTVGPNQTKFDEYLPSVGDTYWVQSQTATTPNAGTVVTLNDTAPTGDQFEFAAIEIPSAAPPPPDTTPPTAPTNLNATAVGPNQVNLTWTASTDNVAVAGYRVFRDGVQIASPATASFIDTAVAPSTTYSYVVYAVDAVPNVSEPSLPASATTPVADTTAPLISNVNVTGITQTAATITWSTDEPATSQIAYGADTNYGSTTTLDSNKLRSHSQTINGLSASTTYHFRVDSTDVAGNPGSSPDGTFTTAAPVADTTLPNVNITAPTAGSTVSANVTLTANATDNVGVVGVQFTIDGAPVGAEDMSSPYSVSWSSTLVADGTHAVSAVARDAAGNTRTATNVSITVANTANDPSVNGRWAPAVSWPHVSIHAALTPTGKVLTFSGDFSSGGQQYLLDPITGSVTQVPNAAADLFCAGQAVLADGRILVIGGTSTSGGYGITAVTAFNSQTQTWQNLPPMARKRWYATGTTLGDGRVLVTSGYDANESDLVTLPEIYNPQTNSWSNMAASATRALPVYPFVYQLPDGRVLWAGASEGPTDTEVLDLATQTWSTIDGRIIDGSSITNYAPNKFMKAGSAADDGFSGPSSRTAFTLDMSVPGATWQPTGSMQYLRSFANLTNLPDGTVLVTGGGNEKSGFVDANAILPAEIWNPSTGTWRTVASMSVPRLYHSVALLLPDGRVFVSGGGGDPGVPDHTDYQIYSPPYLFKGPRPTITSAPATVQYNTSTFIGTPDGADIASVSLIRTGSVTHAFDQNTRMVPLSFTQTAGGLNVQMPVDGNTAPPGYYMLWIVNGQGVPSVSSMVRFPAPFEDNVAPSAPGSLTANGSIGAATLNWSASTDNLAVTGYSIYRSTTSGFTPTAANKVGSVGGAVTTFVDSGRAKGTYFYVVKAEDAAGNASAASNEATAIVPADGSAPSAPGNLQANAASSSLVNLTWTAATDNVAVTRYNVLRNGVAVGTSTTTTYSDPTVSSSTSYTYTVTAQDAAGNVSDPSNPAPVTTPAPTAGVVVDRTVTTRQTAAATTIAAPALTTTGSDELLVAFISSDGPSSGLQTITGVTGGGLTWRLRQRTNTRPGTAEIWQAVAPGPLSNVVITATRGNGSYVGSITVVAFTGASTTVDGAVAGANGTTGASTVTLANVKAGSLVYAVGEDWDRAVARTLPANQTKVDEFLAASGDTFWTQRLTNAVQTAGSVVINTTAPTNDRWDFAAIEIPLK